MLPNNLTDSTGFHPTISLKASSSRFTIATWLILFGMTVLGACNAHALTWDTNPSDGSTITSGSGIWDLDSSNLIWNNNTNSVAWSNGSSAVFGGTPPPVDTYFDILLDSPISATTLTFNTNGYRLYANSPQTLTLTTSTNSILVNGATALIDSNVTILANTPNTAQIRGTGTLQLKGTMLIESVSNNFETGGGVTLEILEGGQLLSANTILVGSQSAAGHTATVVLNGGTIRTGNPVGGNVIGNNRNFILSNADNTTATVIINSGELYVDPNAVVGLRLGQGNNTVAVLSLNGGKVYTRNLFGVNGTNNSSTLNLNGGTIVANNNNSNFMHTLTHAWVQAGGAIIDTSGFNITIAQALEHDVALGTTPDGGLLKLGNGTLTLTGTNTYTGSTVIKGGKLSVNADNKLGEAPATPTPGNIVIDGGTLQATASFTLNANRGIALGSETGSGEGTIEVTGSNTLNYAGIIADNGTGADRLIKTGTGTLALTGSNTFSGGITIREGRLTFNTQANLGQSINPPGYLIVDGGILRFSGDAHLPLNTGLTIGSNGATFEYNSNFNFRFNGKITGDGDLTFRRVDSTTGYLGVIGTNDYTGKTIITANMLVELRANNALGTYGNDENGTLVEGNSTLRINPNGSDGQGSNLTTNEWFTLNSGTITNEALNNTINGQLTLQTNGGTLSANGSSTLTLGGKITGIGNLTKSGSGTVNLTNANNDYSGKTTVTAGTMRVGSGSSLGNSPWVDVRSGANLEFQASSYRLGGSSGTRAVSGTGTITGNVSIGDNFTLRPGTSSDASNMATAGDSTGTLTFNGNLTLEGGASTSIPRVSLTLQHTANITDVTIASNILAFDHLTPTNDDAYDYLNITGSLSLDDNAFVEITLAPSHTLQLGQVFNLIDWTGSLNLDANGDSVAFDSSHLILPDIADLGLKWGTEHFSTHGILYVALVPEPSKGILALLSLLGIVLRRKRR